MVTSHRAEKIVSERVCLIIKAGSELGFSIGVRAWIEVEIWCVKGMVRVKVVSSKKM